MKDYVNEILGGRYLEDEKDNEFEEKFGFSLIDLEEKMNDWLMIDLYVIVSRN